MSKSIATTTPLIRGRAAGPNPRVPARRQGPRGPGRAGHPDRPVRDEGRAAQRRADRGQGVGGPRVPEAAPQRRHRRRGRVRIRGPPDREANRAREHARGAQPRRVHAVLVLSVGGTRTATCLVQVGAVPLPGRDRPARRVGRARRGGAGRPRGARLGQHGGDPLHGPARASERDGGHDRGRARRARHPRRDDRRRARAAAGGSP